jgi:NAD(P)H-hydrate epimerase
MVVGGSVNYVGAPMLSGVGAYRMGTGLVALAVPQSIHPMLAGRIPEAIWLVLNEEDGVISEPAADLVISQFSKVNALVIGPGIGREEATDRFLDKVFFSKYSSGNSKRIGFLVEEKIKEDRINELPEIVVDADGLRWLSANKKWYETVKARMVLTPHPGEMSALTGIPVDEIQKNRMETALEFAQKWGQVVVLKGALTVIAAPDGRVNINPVASSALAKAGSGDVLSGMIASLIGQGLAPFEAASAAVWVHAQAGICAAAMVGDEVSVLASDITDAIPFVLAGLKKNTV